MANGEIWQNVKIMAFAIQGQKGTSLLGIGFWKRLLLEKIDFFLSGSVSYWRQNMKVT